MLTRLVVIIILAGMVYIGFEWGVVHTINHEIESREENKTLKDNVEFLHSCLDDRDKSIQYAEEENKKLKEYNGELIENHKKDIAILCEENKKLKDDLETVAGAYYDR